jgi:hypothetical protein
MTDEPREKHQPEDEVEAHSPPVGLPPIGEAHRSDGDDVEAHSPPVGLPPVGEAHRSDDDEDVEAHSPPIGLRPSVSPRSARSQQVRNGRAGISGPTCF